MKKSILGIILIILFAVQAGSQDTWVGGKQIWSSPTVTSPTITGGTVSGATIDNSVIGGTTAAAGSFTTLTGTTVAGGMIATDVETLTGTATDHLLTPANLTAKLATPGAIGGTTPAAGTFTTVTYKNNVVDGSTGLVLTAAQVEGTIISNTGQGVADVNHTLPAAAAGYHFRAAIGEAQAANYFRFTRAGTDEVILDGTGSKTYVQIAVPTRGAMLNVYTLQVATTGMKSSAGLAIGGTKTNVYSAAFTYDAAGGGYAKAAVAAGTAPNVATTPQNKYGAQAFDIGADGTIDAISCTNIATGFDTPELAVADLPAAAAGHARMGYVTAMSTDAGGFVWGTTEFDAAVVTEAYTSTAAYTKPYAWVCNTITGTWATD